MGKIPRLVGKFNLCLTRRKVFNRIWECYKIYLVYIDFITLSADFRAILCAHTNHTYEIIMSKVIQNDDAKEWKLTRLSMALKNNLM